MCLFPHYADCQYFYKYLTVLHYVDNHNSSIAALFDLIVKKVPVDWWLVCGTTEAAVCVGSVPTLVVYPTAVGQVLNECVRQRAYISCQPLIPL